LNEILTNYFYECEEHRLRWRKNCVSLPHPWKNDHRVIANNQIKYEKHTESNWTTKRLDTSTKWERKLASTKSETEKGYEGGGGMYE